MRPSSPLLFSALWIVATSLIVEWKELENLGRHSILKKNSLDKLQKVQKSGSIGHTTRVPSGGGMTNDFCQQSVDCKGDRKCVEHGSVNDICAGEADCWCIPEDYNSRECSWNADCEAGEVCPVSEYIRTCVSESYADDADEPPNRDGFTLDECSTSDECQPPRRCMVDVNGNVQNCGGRRGCRCLPSQLQSCTAHRECPYGEVCATNRDTGETLCLSEAHVSNSADLVPVPRMLSYDPCVTGKDCEKPRTCEISNMENELRFCLARPGCFCRPKGQNRCEQSRDCVDGEVCVHRTERREADMFCVSQRYASQNEDLTVVDDGTDSSTTSPTSPTTSTSSQEQSVENEICIDAKALHAIDKKSLLYQTHRLATTLCDQFQSCATPGHIVLFRGKAMMMRSYCKITSCKEQVMMVNSPKYQRGLLVPSKTSELHYTPFAARYGTSGEELFLTTLVRLGI